VRNVDENFLFCYLKNRGKEFLSQEVLSQKNIGEKKDGKKTN
jgi:hypothetical protein